MHDVIHTHLHVFIPFTYFTRITIEDHLDVKAMVSEVLKDLTRGESLAMEQNDDVTTDSDWEKCYREVYEDFRPLMEVMKVIEEVVDQSKRTGVRQAFYNLTTAKRPFFGIYLRARQEKQL